MKALPLDLSRANVLPEDPEPAALVGRVMTADGPCIVRLDGDRLIDVTQRFPTLTHLLEEEQPAAALRRTRGKVLGDVAPILANADELHREPSCPFLIAPADLQALKAAGVTFIRSLLERLVEELAGGDPSQAAAVRAALGADFLERLRSTRPGSTEAVQFREQLLANGHWSQYLEVGLGPDAEIFTKAQPMSAIGCGATVGIHPRSRWNNPEPELVLVSDARGRIVGATLGNDSNLRDFEGRSALLLARAKDVNASCVLGPFVRLLDKQFDLDALREEKIRLEIHGQDGFSLHDDVPLADISRDPAELMAQCFDCHQYPDGVMLFLGTPFAPTQDRDEPGGGFTHHPGDMISISNPRLGTLTNRVGVAGDVSSWSIGARALFGSLQARGIRV